VFSLFSGLFSFVDLPSVLWYCWLGLLTCKNRLPYNLYCVGGDVKHCTIQSESRGGGEEPDLMEAVHERCAHEFGWESGLRGLSLPQKKIAFGIDRDAISRGYRGGSPTAVRPSNPALCGSCPLVTPYYCRLGDLFAYFVYIVLCVHYCLRIYTVFRKNTHSHFLPYLHEW